MPSAGPDPVFVERFRGDLERLSGPATDRPIGVALSGGPDSCALLLLAAAAFPGHVLAMTVDHGLRVEAADEAATAAALCATLTVRHEIARVDVGAGSVQAAAREARYAALAEWAMRERLDAILTAHHADDQAETLLMRLARGSGLAGLAGIRASRRLAGLSPHGGGDEQGPMLLRPLLGWRKAELEAIVAAAGIVPVRDPSNHDRRYDRTAARALLGQADWIDTARIAASASYLAEADMALAIVADERYRIEDDGGDIVFDPDPLNEIARRHLRRLFADRFGAHPSGPSLEFTLRLLRLGQTTTCADILCRPEGGLWRFRCAPPRRRSKRSV